MHIEHIAIWTTDLERIKQFYVNYFNATAGNKYVNATRKFESYFLTFDTGCRLEIMQMPGIPSTVNNKYNQFTGLIHFAVSVGSMEQVDKLTDRLRADGYEVVGEPRTTGDGYYESVILDVDGNRVEITI